MFRSMPRRALTAAGAGAIALAAMVSCGSPSAPTPPASCTFALTLSRSTFESGGGSATLNVQAGGSCAWTASASVGWITLTPTSGTGAGDVTVTVQAYALPDARSAAIAVGDVSVALKQDGRAAAPCDYALSPDSKTLGPEGGIDRVTVQTAAGCAWSARTADPWLTLRISSGVGPGFVEYSAPSYSGSDQRQTRVFVGDQSVVVRQDGRSVQSCTYAVDPTSTTLHWHGATGEGVEISLNTQGGCAWTAAVGASWIELLTPGSGQGAATVRTRIGSYTDAATRTAPLMQRWPAATAGQNVWITQEGCRYGLGRRDEAVAAAGGRRQVDVFADPVSTSCPIGCPWTAAVDVAWIHLASATTGSGDSVVFYDVDGNASGSDRIGVITVSGITLKVRQSR